MRTRGESGSNQLTIHVLVDPRPPDHEQQECRTARSREVEVLDQHVGDLCDGEHVDQVEEQLDERDRLLAAFA
jgi:hypothetical protein